MAKNPTGLAVDKELKTTDLSPKIILNSFLLTLELHERQPERRAVRSVGATWLLTKSEVLGSEEKRREKGRTDRTHLFLKEEMEIGDKSTIVVVPLHIEH
jgi:hypothetical protein